MTKQCKITYCVRLLFALLSFHSLFSTFFLHHRSHFASQLTRHVAVAQISLLYLETSICLFKTLAAKAALRKKSKFKKIEVWKRKKKDEKNSFIFPLPIETNSEQENKKLSWNVASPFIEFNSLTLRCRLFARGKSTQLVFVIISALRISDFNLFNSTDCIKPSLLHS